MVCVSRLILITEKSTNIIDENKNKLRRKHKFKETKKNYMKNNYKR